MSILQSLILALTITAGSLGPFTNTAPAGNTQGIVPNGPIKCQSPCRIDDPKCRCNEEPPKS